MIKNFDINLDINRVLIFQINVYFDFSDVVSYSPSREGFLPMSDPLSFALQLFHCIIVMCNSRTRRSSGASSHQTYEFYWNTYIITGVLYLPL